MSRKIGVLIAGLNGAVGNTIVVGTFAASADGDHSLNGMLTETDWFKGVHFPELKDFVFGGWDLNNRTAFDIAIGNQIISKNDVHKQRNSLEAILPMKGVTCKPDYYFNQDNQWEKKCESLSDCLDELKADIYRFKSENSLDSCYVVNLTSPPRAVIENPSNIGMKELMEMVYNNNEQISAPILYAIAAVCAGSGFVDFTSSQTLDINGILEMANDHKALIAGRDGATGETALKASLAEFFQKRNLHVSGWFSTNILGNNDGRVLENAEHGKLKFSDKMKLLPQILGYTDFENIVRINYYRPRGDNKEAWNVVDFKGWLGMDMSLRINLLGRDSILAAPLVLDIIRHMNYSKEIGDFGNLKHLGLYFKYPIGNVPKAFSESFEELLSYYRKS